MEAAGLAIFMISACAFGVLLEHPMSPLHQAIEEAQVRRALMGIAMGLTAIGIVYSPWGQRSGAHLNPVLTLNFLLLGKIAPWDAFFYVVSQFAGGALGVVVADAVVGFPLRHSGVNYVVTAPGPWGAGVVERSDDALAVSVQAGDPVALPDRGRLIGADQLRGPGA